MSCPGQLQKLAGDKLKGMSTILVQNNYGHILVPKSDHFVARSEPAKVRCNQSLKAYRQRSGIDVKPTSQKIAPMHHQKFKIQKKYLKKMTIVSSAHNQFCFVEFVSGGWDLSCAQKCERRRTFKI